MSSGRHSPSPSPSGFSPGGPPGPSGPPGVLDTTTRGLNASCHGVMNAFASAPQAHAAASTRIVVATSRPSARVMRRLQLLARGVAVGARRAFPGAVRVPGSAARRGLARASPVCREDAAKVNITFVEMDGTQKEVAVAPGTHLLDAAHDNDIDLEGACGGELACSTCHLVFEEASYKSLPEKTEEEEDMLDLAWGLTDTSRLGCQVKVTPDMDGMTVTIPDETV